MRKVDDGEKKKRKKMLFIMATNVVASRLPEHRPTGTSHARANESQKALASSKMTAPLSQTIYELASKLEHTKPE